MKYYTVRQGRRVGIFTDWNECKSYVMGYKGAEYKSFTSREEAVAFLNGDMPVKQELSELELDKDTAAAYVDGSYNIKTKVFACGVVMLYDNEEIHMNESFDDGELAQMRNVAGEIKGSVKAMQYCIDNNIKNLHIFYDYEGIEKWCSGAWKANKNGTVEYKAFYEAVKDKLNVIFHKVKGHSGDKYNDIADRLAKDAAGVE